jgi:hypothetical protein
MQDNRDRGNPRHREKRIDRPVDHAATGEGLPLLWQVPACTGASACGDDESGACHVT